MTQKNRLIIVLIYAVLFLVITPYIILHSLGYRVDFANKKIVATGGIYVRVLPQGTDIIIDSKINNKTGLFSNSIFVQDLLPKQHNILIKKDGYLDYQKKLLVKEKEVTKLENVILFKQKIIFDAIKNGVDYFSFAPDNNKLLIAKTENNEIGFKIVNLSSDQKQNFSIPTKDRLDNFSIKWSDDSKKNLISIKDDNFIVEPFLAVATITPLPLIKNSREVSFNPQNSDQIFFIKDKNLYSNKQTLPVIKNIITYQITNQNIIWLSYDGFLYNYDIAGKTNEKISSQIFSVKKSSSYKIKNISGMLFLQENESLFLLNEKSKIIESFYSPVKDIKISPDGQKILYFNNNEVLYSLLIEKQDKIYLIKIPENINDCYWLNSDYFIFESKAKDGKNKIIDSNVKKLHTLYHSFSNRMK